MTKADTILKSEFLIGRAQSRDQVLWCHMSSVYSYHGNAWSLIRMLCLYDGIFTLNLKYKKEVICKGIRIYFLFLLGRASRAIDQNTTN